MFAAKRTGHTTAAKLLCVRILQTSCQAQPHTFTSAAVFRVSVADSYQAQVINPRHQLKLYSTALPLLRLPDAYPVQMAVRGSHVIPMRQSHDLSCVV